MLKMFSDHPNALRVLFFTEMWERFSYYGMRGLLVLYLVNSLEVPRESALEIYATYTGLVYATAVLGGYAADRWLGTSRSVYIGAVLMALGHFAMAIPSLLYLALGLLIAGNGFFKPNISTLVGTLYSKSDPRRDAGFTVFYMGINLGAFLAPLVCGTLGEHFGWHTGFAAAGVGMVAGLLIFARGQRQLYADAVIPSAPLDNNGVRIVAVTSAAIIAVVWVIVQLWPNIATAWEGLAVAEKLATVGVVLITIVGILMRKLTPPELRRVSVVLILEVFVIVFWMGFEQAGGTMNLFADTLTDRTALGFEIPAVYFQSLNPLFIILLAPLFSILWTQLDRSQYALSPVLKQAIGMMILGVGFIVLAIAQTRADTLGPVSPLWLVVVYLIHTLGELCLSPIGLSTVNRLAPTQFAAVMMGIWFLTLAFANYFAGMLENLLAGSGINLYWFLVVSSIGAGAVLAMISPLLHRLMRDQT